MISSNVSLIVYVKLAHQNESLFWIKSSVQIEEIGQAAQLATLVMATEEPMIWSVRLSGIWGYRF